MSMETIKRQLYNSGSVREVWGWLKTPCWDGTQEHSKFKKNIHASDCPAHRDIRRWRSSWQTYQKAVKGTKVKLNLNRPWRHWGEAELQLYSSFKLGTRRWWVFNATSQPLYPRERDTVPLYRRLGGPQVRSGWVRKISPPSTGTRPRPLQLRYPGPWEGTTGSKINL